MYPHERSLVKRLEGKPFALLGINSDTDRDQLKPVLKQEQITWRSWWDRSTGGPISTAWHVHGWPSIFVLDGKGVIRSRDVRGQMLDGAVDALLREMETGRPEAIPSNEPPATSESRPLTWFFLGMMTAPAWLFLLCIFGAAIVAALAEKSIRRLLGRPMPVKPFPDEDLRNAR